MPILRSEQVLMMLPKELVIEFLTWLPGKQLAQCKCVCKLWQAIISSLEFRRAYRSRQRGLIMQRVEFLVKTDQNGMDRCLRFIYSPLCQFKDFTEEFSHLDKMMAGFSCLERTMTVNGLVCVHHEGSRLSIHNVCTGEKMWIPYPPPCSSSSTYAHSMFYLGFDPATRMFKLLRLVVPIVKMKDLRVGAQIITLRPSGSLSGWRELNYNGAGLVNLPWNSLSVYQILSSVESRSFPVDGILSWIFNRHKSLVLFDLNKEKFHLFELPFEYARYQERRVRAQFIGDNQLALYVWIIPRCPDGVLECYVMEDGEGKRWSKHSVQLPEEVDLKTTHFTAEVSNISSGGETLLVNCLMPENDKEMIRSVYAIGLPSPNMMVARFWLGKLPLKPPGLYGDYRCTDILHSCDVKISCLLDSNNLYLSLDDILSGQV